MAQASRLLRVKLEWCAARSREAAANPSSTASTSEGATSADVMAFPVVVSISSPAGTGTSMRAWPSASPCLPAFHVAHSVSVLYVLLSQEAVMRRRFSERYNTDRSLKVCAGVVAEQR